MITSRSKNCLKLVPFLMALILGGCTAKFEPRITSPGVPKNSLPTASRMRAGVEVSVEEFASPNKSRWAFDAEVGSRGVLPLLVRIDNRGSVSYKVRKHQIRATLAGEPLQPMYGYEAAGQGATRNPTWNALVNTAATGYLGIVLGLPVMVASVQHTNSINRKIEQHFESLELSDSLVKPDDTLTGFVFFKLSGGLKTLENVNIELVLEAEGAENHQSHETLNFSFSLPTLTL